MNDFKRQVLHKHESSIYSDVTDPVDISDYLLSKKIISKSEFESITCSPNNMNEKLVKVLLNKSDGLWFEEFVKALSKDYAWISNKMDHDFKSQKAAKLVYYLRGRGNVPPFPLHNITRKNLIYLLRKEIKHLERDEFLVVHGMSGLGKTCLVVDALHDVHLLEEYMNGYVYWLSVGDLREEPNDIQCRQLQEKLCEMVKLPFSKNEDLLYQLKRHFAEQSNQSALLVLDKVWSSKVVEALSVGCKILVTTQDCDVVNKNKKKKLFPVHDGFSENESVQLLKDFVQELPPDLKDIAIKIHRSWKGHPMVIGLIGGELSEFKDEKDHERWRSYERISHSEDNSDASRRRSKLKEPIRQIIDLIINKLKTNDKNLFRKLAVLVEDTNITIDVLRILWGMSKHHGEEAIEHFYRRSLVFKKFNADLQETVYGIHDIIMDYLKSDLQAELKYMHQDLVLTYHGACQGDFANLPKDNYIYSYLCHHIDLADKWNDFRDQFFSLNYIESKLKATNPGDLLLDLKKYSSGLVGSCEINVQKIKHIEKFVRDSGWHIHQGEADVYQCALLQPESSFLYQQAACFLNKNSSSKVYFCSLNTSERPKDLEKEILNVSSISIVSPSSVHKSSERILMYPDHNGIITELDMHYRLQRRAFKEQDKVVMIKMSPLHDKFLSALEDGHVNVWNLNQHESSVDSPPPSLRQRSYLSHFPDPRTTPSLSFKHAKRVTCASFSHDGKLIVSSSEDRKICVWNLEKNKLILSLDSSEPFATSCCFLKGDSVIVYGCQNFKIIFHDLNTNNTYSLKISMDNYGPLLSLLCVTDDVRKLIVVQKRRVQLLSWEGEVLKHTREGPRVMELKEFQEKFIPVENTTITCAVYHQKHGLLLGTDNGCLLLSEILDGSCTSSKFGSGAIKAVDMVSGQIAFAQSKSVKICWLQSERIEKESLSAHLGWLSSGVSVFTRASSDGDVQVYHNGKLFASHICQDICVVRLSTYGNKVLIGTVDGKVLLYDTTVNDFKLLKFDNLSEILYLNVAMYKSNPVYLASAKSGGEECSYTLQALMFPHNQSQSNNVKVPVVKTFLCRYPGCLIAILKNYEVLTWDLNKNKDYLYCVQEGRTSANVNDACLSPKEDTLVLTDEESCFHIISLIWPQPESKSISNLNHSFNNELRMGRGKAGLKLPLPSLDCIPQSVAEPADEVDGIQFSLATVVDLRVSLSTIPLPSASFCCCICSEGNFAAISQNENEVSVWNVKKKMQVISSFSIFPHRGAKVRQIQFSPYQKMFFGKIYELVLFVVSDCMSLWDVSPIAANLLNSSSLNIKPKCIGCVTASGSPLIELSINHSFTKFSAYDKQGRYFLWEVYTKHSPNNNHDNNL